MKIMKMLKMSKNANYRNCESPKINKMAHIRIQRYGTLQKKSNYTVVET